MVSTQLSECSLVQGSTCPRFQLLGLGQDLSEHLWGSEFFCSLDDFKFKKVLKTHLFSRDSGTLVTVVFNAPCTNISSTSTSTSTSTTTTTITLDDLNPNTNTWTSGPSNKWALGQLTMNQADSL